MIHNRLRSFGSLRLVAWSLSVALLVAGLLPSSLACAQGISGFAQTLLTGRADGPAPELAGYRLIAAEPAGKEYALRFAPLTGGAEVMVLLGAKEPGFRAYATTPSFRVSWQSGAEGVATPAGAAALTAAVVAQISERDNGQLQLPKETRKILSTAATSATPVDAPLQTLTWALLFASLLALTWLVATDVWGWQGAMRSQGLLLSQPWLWAAVLVGVGSLLRALAPQTLVMVHMGHELFDQAQTLGPPPKYGPAAPTWLAGWFGLVGQGWPRAVALSQLCSGLTLLLVPGLWLRIGGTAWSAVGAVAGVALTPVLVHDAASESILVPAMLATVGAASAASRWRSQPVLAPLAAGVLAATAMLARPELLLLAPAAVLTAALAGVPSLLRRHRVGLGALLVWFVGLAVARSVQLQAVMVSEQQRGNTPRVFADSKLALAMDLLRDAWWRKNGLLWPQLVPLVWWMGLGWLLWRRPAGARPAWLALGLAWLFLAPTSLDLPWISVPRVQAPAMWWFCAAGGAALWLALERLPKPRRLLVAAMAGGLVAATVPAAFYRHPSETEEYAFAAAVRALPPQATLATRTHADSPNERLHLGVAATLLSPEQRLVALDAILSGAVVPGRDGRVFAWLGSRCAMRPCDVGGRHPACSALEANWALREVQRTALHIPAVTLPAAFMPRRPSHPGQLPDLDFPWCWQQPDVTLRLVEVLGPTGPP